jgi:hypothetical protein
MTGNRPSRALAAGINVLRFSLPRRDCGVVAKPHYDDYLKCSPSLYLTL